MEKIKALRAKRDGVIAEMENLTAAAADGMLSAEAQAKFDALSAEAATIAKNIANLEKVEMEKAENAKVQVVPPAAVIGAPVVSNAPQMRIPAQAKQWSSNLKAFKGANADENAYRSGMWLAAAFGHEKSKQWCRDHGVELKAVHQEGVNTTGGYLVPAPMSSAIIDLVLQYGAFRANAGIMPMTSDTLMVPRTSSSLTAYFVGEGSAITESTRGFDSIKLIVKDLCAITRISNQLASDAIIPIMDNLVQDIANKFAYTEDICGFNGDGTSTYGGITGLATRLATACSSTGLATGTMSGGVFRYDTGHGFSNVAIGDLVATQALLPTYARNGAKWYMSPYFYHAVALGVLAAAGGNTWPILANGAPMYTFLGYPVVLVEAMTSTAATNTIYAYFGNLPMAAKFGDRQQMSISSSDSAVVGGYSTFERNEIALRGIERFDINIHDCGSTSAAGPIVALMSHTG